MVTRKWLRPVALVSVVLLWAFALAQIFGLVSYPFWAIFATINFVFSLTLGREITAPFPRSTPASAASSSTPKRSNCSLKPTLDLRL